MKETEILVDVRSLPPRERNPAMLKAWNDLQDGESVLLVSEQELTPWYYQLACEHTGTFRWEYQEQGPETWRLRLTKGHFPDPGYAPPKKPGGASIKVNPGQPIIVDTRPIFQKGETPCQLIEEAAEQTAPGQTMVLIAPFEPAPLYAKLGKQGFTHRTSRMDDGSFRIEFNKSL